MEAKDLFQISFYGLKERYKKGLFYKILVFHYIKNTEEDGSCKKLHRGACDILTKNEKRKFVKEYNRISAVGLSSSHLEKDFISKTTLGFNLLLKEMFPVINGEISGGRLLYGSMTLSNYREKFPNQEIPVYMLPIR